MWRVLTHLTVIAFHVIVLVHGYNTNGFVRPLERNSDRQTQLKPISPKDTPPSYSVQSDKSFKRSIKSVRTLSAKRWNVCTLKYFSASQPWSLRVCQRPFYYQWSSIIVSEFTFQQVTLKIGLRNHISKNIYRHKIWLQGAKDCRKSFANLSKDPISQIVCDVCPPDYSCQVLFIQFKPERELPLTSIQQLT